MNIKLKEGAIYAIWKMPTGQFLKIGNTIYRTTNMYTVDNKSYICVNDGYNSGYKWRFVVEQTSGNMHIFECSVEGIILRQSNTLELVPSM